jgi:hypothetical protein
LRQFSQQPFVSRQHLDTGYVPDVTHPISIKHQNESASARMLFGGLLERSNLARNNILCLEVRTDLEQFFAGTPVASEKIHLKSIGGLDVAYLGPTSFELVEHCCFECVPCISPTAGVKRTNEPGVRRINLAWITISLAFRVGCHGDSANKKCVYEMT